MPGGPAPYEPTTNVCIINGPSKWDLMLAIFDSTSSNPRVLTFEITDDSIDEVEVRINGVRREDSSGESWSMSGRLGPVSDTVKIYFNTQTRKGRMELSKHDYSRVLEKRLRSEKLQEHHPSAVKPRGGGH